MVETGRGIDTPPAYAASSRASVSSGSRLRSRPTCLIAHLPGVEAAQSLAALRAALRADDQSVVQDKHREIRGQIRGRTRKRAVLSGTVVRNLNLIFGEPPGTRTQNRLINGCQTSRSGV